MWVLDVQSAESLCNHFYFPLLASLPSDLDCISHGRQRQNERMLAMACAPACIRLLLGVTGDREDAQGGGRTFQ